MFVCGLVLLGAIERNTSIDREFLSFLLFFFSDSLSIIKLLFRILFSVFYCISNDTKGLFSY